MEKTEIQRRIEKWVTNEMRYTEFSGYEMRKALNFMSFAEDRNESEVELQQHLAAMDYRISEYDEDRDSLWDKMLDLEFIKINFSEAEIAEALRMPEDVINLLKRPIRNKV